MAVIQKRRGKKETIESCLVVLSLFVVSWVVLALVGHAHVLVFFLLHPYPNFSPITLILTLTRIRTRTFPTFLLRSLVLRPVVSASSARMKRKVQYCCHVSCVCVLLLLGEMCHMYAISRPVLTSARRQLTSEIVMWAIQIVGRVTLTRALALFSLFLSSV